METVKIRANGDVRDEMWEISEDELRNQEKEGERKMNTRRRRNDNRLKGSIRWKDKEEKRNNVTE